MQLNAIIVENFNDNGGHSHWSVIDAENGKTIIEDITNCANLSCDEDCAYKIGDKECLNCRIYQLRVNFYRERRDKERRK